MIWDLVNLGPFDYINQLIPLSVITLSGAHCIYNATGFYNRSSESTLPFAHLTMPGSWFRQCLFHSFIQMKGLNPKHEGHVPFILPVDHKFPLSF